MSNWRKLDVTSIERLTNNWWNRLREAQGSHYLAANIYRVSHFGLGISVIVCSTIVLSFSFAGTTSRTIAILSVLAGVAGSIQTFMQPIDLSEKHRAAAARFSALRREVEQFAAEWREGLIVDAEPHITGIRQRWATLLDEVPVLPKWIWMQAGRQHTDESPDEAGI